MTTLRYYGHEGHLFVVVHTLNLDRPIDVDASLFELSLFLQLCQAPRLFQLLLSHFSRRFLTLGVGQARPALLQHLLLIFVHVDRVGPRRLRLRVGINFASQPVSGVVRIVRIPTLRYI